MDKIWKIVILGSVAALAISAITISFVLLPNPIFATGPPPFGMFHHGGYWANGIGPNWQRMSYFSGNSTGNWTGTVSLNSIKTQTIDSIKDKVKVSVGDAAAAAEKSLGAGSRIGAVNLAPVNGYLVYSVLAIDSSDNVHRLFVDVRNGNVLAEEKIDSSQASLFSGNAAWGQWHQAGGWWMQWHHLP